MTVFSPLASAGATRAVVERFGLGLKKSLGQNFLVNDAVIGKILSLAEVAADERILEVGPGIGTLTAALLTAGAEVISIERDPRLYEVLPYTLADFSGFHLIEKDALDVGIGDLACALAADSDAQSGFERAPALPLPHKMVANLPYAVAATIILDYFQRFGFLESATVMVQREVAQRICAVPGNKNYGAYTVKLSLYAGVVGSFPVASGNFMPAPHVESTVVRLDRHQPICASGILAEEELIRAACVMADAAFHARRKTIANSMKAYFADDAAAKGAIARMLREAGIDPARRGETFGQQEFLSLGGAYLACTGGSL